MDEVANQSKYALIYEDHQFFGQAFAEVLKKTNEFTDVYVFTSENTLVTFCNKEQEAILFLFLDFYIGKNNTLHLVNELRELPLVLRIIMVSSVDSPALIKKILSHRIDGFLSKIDCIDEVIEFLSVQPDKHPYISPTIKELLLQDKVDNFNPELTEREIEILSFLSIGKSTAEVADLLNLSIHTVMTHRKNIMAKICVKNISHAIVYAIKAGLI
jgi:DNA-binding NarL/FixJ family response regulator